MDIAPIVEHYEREGSEGERLTNTALGRLEFERTRSLLRRHLPPAPATVLDVGGGTGVHAAWLAAEGWSVRLFDVVPAHVAQAAADLAHVPAAVADARALPADDEVADAVLLLGPLYHLIGAEDRVAALAEAHRVTRPGGTLVAAAIGRYADLLSLGVDGRLDDAGTARVRDALVAGDHPATDGFTAAHLHTVAELAGEVTAAGWEQPRVSGRRGRDLARRARTAAGRRPHPPPARRRPARRPPGDRSGEQPPAGRRHPLTRVVGTTGRRRWRRGGRCRAGRSTQGRRTQVASSSIGTASPRPSGA